MLAEVVLNLPVTEWGRVTVVLLACFMEHSGRAGGNTGCDILAGATYI